MGLTYSSTQRNNDADEFLTPQELIKKCVWLLTRHYRPDQYFRVLDAGANRGQWGDVVRKVFPNAEITGVEIMDLPKPDSYDFWVQGDYLRWNPPDRWDVVLGNPPYSVRYRGKRESVAEYFVRKSLSILRDSGWLYFLLRSGWSASRIRLWKDRDFRTKPGIHQLHHYLEQYHVTPRPSFYKEDSRTSQYGTTKTNEHEYSLYSWWKPWWMQFGFSRELDWEYNREVGVTHLTEWTDYTDFLRHLGIPIISYGVGLPCVMLPDGTKMSVP